MNAAVRGWAVMVGARLRANRMSLLVLTVLMAVLCTAQLQAFVSVFPDKATRTAILGPFVNNTALRVLYGYPYDIADPAGWVAWRNMTFAGIIMAMWAAIITTGALRGEEDAGRGELVLSGLQPRRRWFAAVLTATALQAVVIGAVSVTALAADGVAQHLVTFANCVELGLQLVLPALLFAAIAALTSQLAGTVRAARLLAAGILVAAFILRAPADIGVGIPWLRWVTPLGWFELLRPPATPSPLVLTVIAVGIVVPIVISLPLLAMRDIGAGVLPVRDSRPARRALLGASWQAALRDEAAHLGFWLVGTATYALLMGAMVKTALDFLRRAPVYAQFFGDKIAVDGFIAAFYSLIQLIAALLAVTLLVAARGEEASGRLEIVLAMPRSRIGWLCGRALLAVGLAMVVCVIAAAAIWTGAAATGVRVGIGSLFAAAANSLPLIVVTVGVTAAVLGVAPRAVAFVYALVATVFLWDALGSALKAPNWSLQLSPFHALARVPMQQFALAPALWVTAIGLGSFGAALFAFRRRDLAMG
ncbi:hypothetical protein [Nocardia sp. NPDC005998]|uniref:hypothetical protein n=1 Tax=Nocardia sp. NPDC005998 TaxID=3156894 RepID=UPI0033B91298